MTDVVLDPHALRDRRVTDVVLDPHAAPEAVRAWLDRVYPDINDELDRRFPQPAGPDPGRLREAMRYAIMGPGKRLRPALTLAACAAVSGDGKRALCAAAAVEALHAYTLVHDDLPAMDDDELRRGRPTVHVVYGEAIAILAGDGLLTAALGALADLDERAGPALRVLSARAGVAELLGGQARDLAMGSGGAAPRSIAELEVVHAAKTGALFAAATELGGIAGNADPRACERLARFGMAFGIAFQHADDVDDDEFAELRDAARARMHDLGDEAAGIAGEFGAAGQPLAAFAEWIRGTT